MTVTLIHKNSDTEAEGGVLTWLDCGMAGNWVTDPVAERGDDDGDGVSEDDDVEVEVRPATAEEIARELIAYLPTGFGPDDSEPDDGPAGESQIEPQPSE